MKTFNRRLFNRIHQAIALSVSALMVILTPTAALAQEAADTTTTEEPVVESTAAPSQEEVTVPEEQPAAQEESEPEAPPCTASDAGCGQGADQGTGQGAGQGGPSIEELGGYTDEEGNDVLPAGVEDTRQGAVQGSGNGATSSADVSASNTNTGADSNNTGAVTQDTTKTTNVSNAAKDTSTVAATGNTGGNTNNSNTGTGATKTGNANIGITQVKNDNTTALNGQAGVSVNGHQGDYIGDLEVDFNNAISLLAGDGSSKSIQAINNNTGSDSSNDLVLSFNDISDTEVQNDGEISNVVDATAITGQNEANKNTSDASITTGDANIAATLVNLLNTTVLNGNLMISVQDVFGNLIGDIAVPDLGQMASFLSGGNQVSIEAENSDTGSDSTNEIAVDIDREDTTSVKNDADIETKVDATAITGQNEASKNTGGGHIDTGDASVSASNVTIANTTVEGGNWGLVIVNALNKWVGFLVGDSGEVRALSQDETIREIEARNSETGADSDNTIEVTDSVATHTNVSNDASVKNDVTATAITGQNTASMNTGMGDIDTGEANILATAVNIANTTVKNANLGIAVINVFGDWFGDLLYAGNSLLASGGGTSEIELDANNSHTGADSTNTVDVDVDRNHETTIDNNADIDTILSAEIDTGNNTTNRNTSGADIETGKANLALHARTIANLSALAGPDKLFVDVESENDNTGVDSENTVRARVNDNRLVTISNDANVSTILPGLVNTGNNEASFNTIGGDIDTGDIDADIAVENMINRVLLAMGGEVSTVSDGADVEVLADLLNDVTGQESLNENDVEVTRAFLASIFNDATVDTIIDLLFNTGGNASNGNTAASSKNILSATSLNKGTPENEYESAEVVAIAEDQDELAYEAQSASDTETNEDTNEQEKVLAVASVDSGNGGTEGAIPVEEEALVAPAATPQPIAFANQSVRHTPAPYLYVPKTYEPTATTDTGKKLSSVTHAFSRAITKTFSPSDSVESDSTESADESMPDSWPMIAFVGSVMGLGAGGVAVRRRVTVK